MKPAKTSALPQRPLNAPIDAWSLAQKIDAARRRQDSPFADFLNSSPRALEICWALQYFSAQPAGLIAVAETLLELFPDRLGTPAMHAAGKTGANAYTEDQREAIKNEFPIDFWYADNEWQCPARFSPQASAVLRRCVDEVGRHSQISPEILYRPFPSVPNPGPDYFLNICRQLMLVQLPYDLYALCALPGAGLPDVFYFHSLVDCLISLLDALQSRAFASLARTQVAEQIIDAADFALTERAMVEITGSSRFGKSETGKTIRDAQPGQFRVVNTPCDNTDRAWYEALCAALGVVINPQMTPRAVKARLNYTVSHCRLCLIVDEAHWLAPQRYSGRTTPLRYNWLRSVPLENGCGIVLLVTPQFHAGKKDTFEKVSQWNAAQWHGRIMRSVKLPDEMPDSDLLMVVEKQFSELPCRLRRSVISAALMSDSYLFAVEKIARNTRSVARKDGRDKITVADLDRGIALSGYNLPSLSAPSAGTPTPARCSLPVAPSPRAREQFIEDVRTGRLGAGTRILENATVNHLGK